MIIVLLTLYFTEKYEFDLKTRLIHIFFQGRFLQYTYTFGDVIDTKSTT